MRFIGCFLLLAAATAQAATPTDFAYGLKLDTSGGGAVFEVDLPATIYSGVTRTDLGDLRVFNARGEEVPYTVRPQERVQGVAPAPQPVPLFPLYGETRDGDLGLRVQTGAGGAIVELKQKRAPGNREPVAYLFDLSALRMRPTALELRWELPAASRGFVGYATVSASDDLAHWHTVAGDATVGDLGYGGNRLERRQIDLPAFAGKYLRLEWPEEARAARITAAEAHFAAPASYPDRQWFPLEGTPDPKQPLQFQFFSGGYFPVDCARVVPREANTVARLTLASRAGPNAPWQRRGAGVVYNLTGSKGALTSDSFCFAPTTDREWRLSVEENGGGLGNGRPILHLGWNPQRLVFVARGEAPFTLAWGSARVAGSNGALDPLLQNMNSQQLAVGKATVAGPGFALGGPAQLEAKRELPWRRILLWVALVAGVLGLAWMAARLVREMNPPRQG